jgi:uncharacterized iron-regulated membrane protein
MSAIQKAFHFGWQRNFQFNHFRNSRAMKKDRARNGGVFLSIIIAFFIFTSIAFFLSYLNKSIEKNKITPQQRPMPIQNDIVLRV